MKFTIDLGMKQIYCFALRLRSENKDAALIVAVNPTGPSVKESWYKIHSESGIELAIT